jgi:pyruvate formate lyase activating enzyme
MTSQKKWQQTGHPARLWHTLENGRVLCELCPRQCEIASGRSGICRVRRNEGGALVSLNFGKSVPMTQEFIESEAVYHYAPGESILSLGNIGCMLRCDFCQNWSTSQARFVTDKQVACYQPEEIVDYALRHGIRMLSWTYNDPVVWHEFVLDTARLARERGLKNLYKSAFYISEQGIDDLLEVMDIFSISLKSMQETFYRKHTGGRLQPILDGIQQVYAARKSGRAPHLEISNLCVTGRNDTLAESRLVTDWMLKNLDPGIPLHYVRFHPDYRYTQVARTSPAFLEEARKQALADGMQHVYVGNVWGTPSANSCCTQCGALLVQRGQMVSRSFLVEGACPQCGASFPIIDPWRQSAPDSAQNIPPNFISSDHRFRGPIRACHVQQESETEIFWQFISASGDPVPGRIGSSACTRFMLSKNDDAAAGVRLWHTPDKTVQVFELYDRAHFPVLDAARTCGHGEDIPMPLLERGHAA